MGSPQPDLYVTECSPSPSPPSSPVSNDPDREQDPNRTHFSLLRPAPTDATEVSLKEQLEACRAQVQQLEKLLSQSLRKERIADTYNQDLRQQVEDLSREIHERKKREKAKTDVAVQTEDYTSWSHSDYYYPHENYYQSYDVPVDALQANHQNEDCIPIPASQLVTNTSVHASTSIVENGQSHDAALGQNTEKAEAPSSLAESLRATAEAAVSQTGFIYDENTGWYFDHSTGFYYDSENQLYYDPNSGSYYYFDADSEQYLFHSRVDLTSSQMMTHQMNEEKKKTKKQPELCGTAPHVGKDIKVEDQASVTNLPYHYTSDQQMGSVKKEDNSTQKKKVKRGPSVVDGTHKTEKPVLRQRHSSDQNTESTAAFASVDDSDEEEGNSDTEEGEITNSEVEEDCCEDDRLNENCTDSDNSEIEETAHAWPPCIRVIVVRSPVLETATLFIITAVKKATIGRENDMEHAIQIPESVVNKFHAEVYFDHSLQSYVLVDQGSENGTVINGNHILQPAIKSEPYVLEHGDEVKIGETVLSFHMHTGTETCYGCEPGQIRAHLGLDKKEQTLVTVSAIVTRAEKERLRRKELKQIRAKYGLQNFDYEENQALKNLNYRDRAGKRRRTVGSEGTFQRDDAPASVHIEINDTNKGHKMLKKMGWKKGEGLGKHGKGIKDPIQLQIRKKKAGLGAQMATSIEDMPAESKNKQNWELARKRFSEFFPNIKLKDTPQGTPWVKETSE
ncbi:angiogenic factor with G patch and FHA domains 1 isoform X2 [Lissotriton helveticus]